MLFNLSHVYAETIQENNTSYSEISKNFNLTDFKINANQSSIKTTQKGINVKLFRSIKELDKEQWNEKFLNNGNLSYSI